MGMPGHRRAAGTAHSATAYKVSPKVTGFVPTSAIRGTSIEIDGSNFTGATAVLFGTVAATTFNVADDNTIHATVPATAVTGKVTVTTPSG